jgi:hypothetical protein
MLQREALALIMSGYVLAGWVLPGFPVKFVGVDELHAAFLNESRTRGRCLVPRTGNPGISLVFREMWDTTDVDRKVRRTNRESEGKSSGIPYLAKNERDMGHGGYKLQVQQKLV